MNKKICVSLGDIPFLKCMELASICNLVEIRLDLLKIDTDKIELLALQCRQWIATCRPGDLTERERTELLAASVRSGAAYIDIEYEAEKEYRQPLIDLAKRLGCKVIISYHNYEITPDVDYMKQIIECSKAMGADYVKIAVMANNYADCARLMFLYSLYPENILAYAMGEVGKITRVAAPFLGAKFTYASIDEAQKTALGQLTAMQMETISDIMTLQV